MFLVLLYHLYCVNTLRVMNLFRFGFIGVDIFLLLGGMTLGFSLEKRNLREFYKRRIKRILPLYLLFTTIKTILYCITGRGIFSFTDIIYSISGLSFFGIGGILMEWYLFSLFLLYLAYPFLYYLTKRIGFLSPVIAFAFVLLLYLFNKTSNNEWLHLQWYHNAFISRIPIFILGIYLYIRRNKGFQVFDILIIAISTFVFTSIFNANLFFIISCLSLLLVLLLYAIKKYNPLTNFLDFIGKYTLEIYVGNCFCQLLLCDYFTISNQYFLILIYIVINFIFSFMVIQLNKLISKLI